MKHNFILDHKYVSFYVYKCSTCGVKLNVSPIELVEDVVLNSRIDPVCAPPKAFNTKKDLTIRIQALESALREMCKEFRALDLPYGSKAYAKANELINTYYNDHT